MKILWLSHLVPYPPRAGVAQRSYGLLKELCGKHEVSLMAFHQPGLMSIMSEDPESELEDAIATLRGICADVEVFDIPSEKTRAHRYAVALSSVFRRFPYTINWLESAAYSTALRSAVAPDLVHFDTISLAEYRHDLDDVPRVMNHHNIESHLLARRAGTTSSPISGAYYRQEAERLRSYEHDTADEFVVHLTCSDLDRERLLEVAPNARAEVVPNGVDVDYFRAAEASAPETTFVFVGTLGWGPNRAAADFIARELWPALGARWPEATMHLVGSKPPESARRLAERDSRFVVTGFVEDARPFMANACFFLCPITDGGGTKLKILNAMATGRVVVADPIACEGINAEPGTEIVTARTAAEYIDAIESLLGTPDRYLAICAAARARIEQEYSYAAIGRDLAALYEAIVADRPRRN